MEWIVNREAWNADNYHVIRAIKTNTKFKNVKPWKLSTIVYLFICEMHSALSDSKIKNFPPDLIEMTGMINSKMDCHFIKKKKKIMDSKSRVRNFVEKID